MRLTIRILGLACFTLTANLAIAQQEHMVRTDLARASVIAESGHVNFNLEPSDDKLSFPNKSFFTIRIEDKIYTNNDNPPDGVMPLPTATSASATSTAIITTWDLTDVKIEQRVESRMNAKAEMVLSVSYAVTNRSSANVQVQPQYLLDVKIGRNDRTYYALYGSQWSETWSRATAPVPELVIFTEQEFAPPSYDVGIVTELTFDNTMPKLPSLLIIGHWEELETIAFVDPKMTFPPLVTWDGAALMQWEGISVKAGERVELGAFYYGPSKFVPSSVGDDTESKTAVWPNPATNVLRVKSDSRHDARIQNLLGQAVWTSTIEGEASIDVQTWVPGTYFLMLGDRAYPIVVTR
jgi:hypothetical protein